MTTPAGTTAERRVDCMCRTTWQVNRGDKWINVPPNKAAEYYTCGFSVRLAQVSTTPLVPVTPAVGVHYAGMREYVVKACDVCGWPTIVAATGGGE